MTFDPTQFREFMKKEEIDEILDKLATQINKDYGVEDKVLLIGELKGAFMTCADLIRRLHSDVSVDFVRTKKHGYSMTSPGTITLVKDISMDVRDRHVLIVEEVVDSGRTLKFLYDRLKSAFPKSVKIATLLDKKASRVADINVDYVGLDVGKEFLIGYGMDLEEECRNFKDIFALKYPN